VRVLTERLYGMQVKTAATPAPAPDESKAAQSAVKKDDVEAAAAPEETAASASAPGPSSVDGEASSKATGPSPSEAPSQSGSTGEDKTPVRRQSRPFVDCESATAAVAWI
jgi:hypothetical protein